METWYSVVKCHIASKWPKVLHSTQCSVEYKNGGEKETPLYRMTTEDLQVHPNQKGHKYITMYLQSLEKQDQTKCKPVDEKK